MSDDLEAFLAGERTDDVVIYLADAAVDDPEPLAGHGDRVDGGTVLVLPGPAGRELFGTAVGTDAMAFAKAAMDGEGTVDRDLKGGTCGVDPDHEADVIFAFAEAENEEVGGIYAEGDVIHAYARCACGESYSSKWVAGER